LKSVLITFSGIDGAGKTTQIEKLRTYFAQAAVPVYQVTFWDDVVLFRDVRSGFSRAVLQSDGAVGTPERPAQRRDKNTQAWPLLLGRCVLHLFDVLNLRRIVKKARAEAAGVIIFDRYIYDQLAALPMDHWPARSYARLLLSIAPKPEISYLLDAVPEVARARKPEYPLEFMRKYRNSYLELRKMAGMQLIPAADPDDVHLAILDRLEKSLLAFPPQSQIDSAVTA
jgi:thymidylate kinase